MRSPLHRGSYCFINIIEIIFLNDAMHLCDFAMVMVFTRFLKQIGAGTTQNYTNTYSINKVSYILALYLLIFVVKFTFIFNSVFRHKRDC